MSMLASLMDHEREQLAAVLRHAPRQARSVQRVEHILATADTLFAERGYDAVTTNEIAARAGIPIGSLYQFFADKEAIVHAMAIAYRSGMAAQLQLESLLERGPTLRRAVHELISRLLVYGEANFGFTRILLGGVISPAIRPAVEIVQHELMARLQDLLAYYLVELPPSVQRQTAAIVVTALQALLTYGIAQKYSAGPATTKQVFEETKRMIVAYVEAVAADWGSADSMVK